MSEDGSALNLRNVLVLLGVVVTTVGLIYFAVEFSDVISDWGRVISLALLAVVYVSLGVHVEQTLEKGSAVVERPGWQWLRISTALHVLGLVAAFASVLSFLVVDDLTRTTKALVTILVGLALILVAAWRFRAPAP